MSPAHPRFKAMTMTNLLLVVLLLLLLFAMLSVLVTSIFSIGLVMVLLFGLIVSRHLHTAQVETLAKDRCTDVDATRASVTKLVKSFGSKWARIRDSNEASSNAHSLDQSVVSSVAASLTETNNDPTKPVALK